MWRCWRLLCSWWRLLCSHHITSPFVLWRLGRKETGTVKPSFPCGTIELCHFTRKIYCIVCILGSFLHNFPAFLSFSYFSDFFYSERASEAPFGKCPELTPRAFFMWKSKLEPGRNVFQTIPTKEMFPKAEHSPRYKTKDGQHLLPSLVRVKKFVFAIKGTAKNITFC